MSCDHGVKRNASCSIGGERPAGRARTTQGTPSGDEHPAGTFTLLFADVGRVDPRFQQSLIHDPRPAVASIAMQDIAEDFGADVVAEVAQMSSTGASFNMHCSRDWEQGDSVDVSLTGNRTATAVRL